MISGTKFNSSGVSLAKVLGVSTLLAMLFPWVSFNILKFDTQPWYIMLGLTFILLCPLKKVPKIIWFSYLMPAVALYVGSIFYESIDILTLRAIFSYLGLSVSIHSFYLFKRYYSSSVLPTLIGANIIWLLAGLIQSIFGQYILTFIVNARTTDNRGVTSLAPEPTFFAIFLIFISWLIWIESDFKLTRRTKTLITLNFLAVVTLAQSSIGLLFILYFFFIYSLIFILRRRVIRTVLFGLPFVVLLVSIYLAQNPYSRITALASSIIEDPLLLIKKDQSVNIRVAHIILPLYGASTNMFLPAGYHSYQKQLVRYKDDFGGLFVRLYDDGAKINSAISSAIFELGWLSIVFLSVLVNMLWNRYELKRSMFNIIIMFSFLLASIPIAFPVTGMILAATYFRTYNQRSTTN